MVEIFHCGAVLLCDPKTSQKFKVNGQRLKPYLENEALQPPVEIGLKELGHSVDDPCSPPLLPISLLLISLLYLLSFFSALCLTKKEKEEG